ncbi:MAG: CpsD/CapB family tyrosine-protein kinase [Acidobacteriia bacterium]|nr:CpsD/CapB family tyrosine-protein kinase [Terriglobia bacterium]
MSRLFEALQRSESERSGTPLTQSPPVATQLLQAAEAQGDDFGQCQRLQVSVSAESRLVSLTAKESLGAEKFRFLGVRLRQLRQNRPIKKVLVTSSIAEEGKSLTAANLALTLARRQQQRVLLLEGDLRRPVLAGQFGLSKLVGVSEALQGEFSPTRHIYYLEDPKLWFMPAGHPPENPLELMQSGRLTELMGRLAAGFDWIVIDSPPVLPLADTTVWARLADGVLLVAREGKTERQELKRGVEALGQTNLLGVVLNSCSDTDHSNYYQRYGPHVAGDAHGLGANGNNSNASSLSAEDRMTPPPKIQA